MAINTSVFILLTFPEIISFLNELTVLIMTAVIRCSIFNLSWA